MIQSGIPRHKNKLEPMHIDEMTNKEGVVRRGTETLQASGELACLLTGYFLAHTSVNDVDDVTRFSITKNAVSQ